LLDAKAKDIDDQQMDKMLHSGYGMSPGPLCCSARNKLVGWQGSVGIPCKWDRYKRMAAICCVSRIPTTKKS
jgi:hypothetical protein